MVIVDSKELHNTITQHIRTQLCKLCSCVLSYSVVKSFAVWMSVCKTTLFDYIATSDRRYRSVVLVTVVLCCVVSTGGHEGDIQGPQRQQHAHPGTSRRVASGPASRQEQAEELHRSVVSRRACRVPRAAAVYIVYIDRDGRLDSTRAESFVRQWTAATSTHVDAGCRPYTNTFCHDLVNHPLPFTATLPFV